MSEPLVLDLPSTTIPKKTRLYIRSGASLRLLIHICITFLLRNHSIRNGWRFVSETKPVMLPYPQESGRMPKQHLEKASPHYGCVITRSECDPGHYSHFATLKTRIRGFLAWLFPILTWCYSGTRLEINGSMMKLPIWHIEIDLREFSEGDVLFTRESMTFTITARSNR